MNDLHRPESFLTVAGSYRIHRLLLCIAFLGLLLVNSVGHSFAQSARQETIGAQASSSNTRQSEFLVELKARQLSEEHSEATKKRKVIQEVLARATLVKGKLDNHTVSIDVTESHIEDLNDKFEVFFQFVTSNPATSINENTIQLMTVRRSYEILTRNWRDNVLQGHLRELREFGRRDGVSSSRPPDPATALTISLFENAEGQTDIGTAYNYGPDVLDDLSNLLYRRGRDDSETTAANLLELTKNIKDSVPSITVISLTKVVQDNLSFNQKLATTFETLLKSEEAKHQEAIRQLELNLENLNSQLIGVERTRLSNQSQVNAGLITAVYLMIGAILVMFLALRVFNDPTAKSIIEKRALVELVGISFLLITIIILGTGGKIEESALAALLGTIAGYVFGRGVGPQASQDPPPKPADG